MTAHRPPNRKLLLRKERDPLPLSWMVPKKRDTSQVSVENVPIKRYDAKGKFIANNKDI